MRDGGKPPSLSNYNQHSQVNNGNHTRRSFLRPDSATSNSTTDNT